MPRLAAAGVKRLAVLCPSFVSDCLETLEEIGLRAKDQWRETLAKTLMGYARANPDPYRGRPVPSIVYDLRAGRRACANVIEEIEKA